MKHKLMWVFAAVMGLVVQPILAVTLCTGESSQVRVDFRTGTLRTPAATETLTYSTEWFGGDAVTLAANGTTLASGLTGSGTYNWTPSIEGVNTLTHTVVTSGVPVVLSAQFITPQRILAQVSTSPNMTAAVYTNGVLSSEQEAGKWYVWSNETATVVYTANDGYAFTGNKMQVTLTLDTTKNPATAAETPTPVEAHSHDGVVFATAISNFSQLNALFSSSSGGSGYLTADIELSSTLDSRVLNNKVINICLNGHVITAPSSGQAINYLWGKDLFLANCQQTEHKFRVEENGRWVRDEANGTETIAGGCIVGGKSMGIRVCYISGAFKMSGINLVGCQADSGVQSSGISCGSPISAVNCGFYGNLGPYGGAMYLFADANRGPFKNCVFKGNKCLTEKGGAVMVNSYSATSTLFEDCLFEGNTSVNHGGAIYDNNSNGTASLIMTNCTLRGNVATGGNGYGGAIYTSNPLICSGCLIESNQATSVGGVYCLRTLTMSDTVVQYNTSARDGGGISLSSWFDGSTKTCTITRGAIRGNRANADSGRGGGISVDASRILNLYDVIVEGNAANSSGGIATWGTINQYGGVVRHNQADYIGGVGAPTVSGSYNLIDGQITENCGGGVGGNTKLCIGGEAYIYGNTNTLGNAEDFIYSNNIGFIDGHPLTDGAKIGLCYTYSFYPEQSVTLTKANAASIVQYFRANNGAHVVFENADHSVGLKYPSATSIGSEAELTTAIAALTPGCTEVWNITADFTVTAAAAIKLNGFNLTINGNGRTITAAQAGTELASVFDIESQGSSAAMLFIKDLNLSVGDGFRTGLNVTTAAGDDTARTEVECENVKITMEHTAAPVGGDAVALVNADAAVSFARGSKITVNDFSRAAVDLTASAKDTVLSVESSSVSIADNRPIVKICTDPLVKLTDLSSGAKQVTVEGAENAELLKVGLTNGSGYNTKVYISAVVPSVTYAAQKVYSDGTEVEGPDYLIISNSNTYVVYEAPADHVFTNGMTAVTNFFDTATNPATVIGALPEVSRIIAQPSADNGYTFVVDEVDCTVTYQWYTNGASSRALTAADLGAIGGTLDFANGTYASANNGYIYGTYACLSNQLIAAGGVITFKCNIDIDLYTQNDDGTLTKAADGTYTYVAKDNSGEYNLWVYGNDEFTLTNLATPAAGAVAIAGETNPKLSFLRDKTESFCTASFTPTDPLLAPFAITSDTVSRELITEQPSSFNDFTFSVISDDYPGTVAYQWYKREIKMRPVTVDDIEDISCGTFNDDGSFTSGNDGLEKIYFTLKADVFDPDYKVTFKTTDSAVEYYNNAGLTGEEANQYYYEVNKLLYFSAYKMNDATPYTLTDFKVPYWAVTPIAGETAAQLSLAKQVEGETYQCKATYTRTGSAEAEFVLTSEAATRYHAHDGVEFKTAIGTEAELRSFCEANGTGYLTADITLTSDFSFNNAITNRLCLNGHVLKQDESCIGISGGRYLAIYDCDKTTPHYFDANTQYGNWTPTNEVTANVVYGGYILGRDCLVDDSCSIDLNTSSLELCGGTLVGACSWSTISADYESSVTFSGGNLVGNFGETCVWMDGDDEWYGTNVLRVTGGTFRNNKTYSLFYSRYGNRVEITGGVFRDNAAFAYGGCVVEGYNSVVIVGGDTVITNNANTYPVVMVAGEQSVLKIRDDVLIAGNQGSCYGGGVLTWGGASVTVSGRVRIVDNEGGNYSLYSQVSGPAGAAVTVNDTVDFNGLEDGAYIGLCACGYHYETGYAIDYLPRYANEPIVVSSNITAAALAYLHLDFETQYFETSVSGEATSLLLKGRLIAEPSAKNDFTYELDTTSYSGGTDEGKVAYQWYPSTMTGRVIKSVDPDVPDTCQYCTRWPMTFDPEQDCWAGSSSGFDKERSYAFVGFTAKKGDVIRYVGHPAVSYEMPWIILADSDDYYNYCEVVEERTDGLVEYKTIVPADGAYYICEWIEELPTYDTYIVSNLTVTTQTIDYEHPIAGQTSPAYDFATSPIDEGTFANVASFIDADGVTTNFTMKSGIIGFHVNRDEDGNVIARYDQPINTQAALEELFENGGAGYLTADFKMSAAGKEFNVDVGTVVDLCLSGHVLDLNGGFISNEGTLRIVDCLDNQIPHYFAVGEDMRWVLTTDVTAAKCVKGGVIYNGLHDDGDEDNPGAVSSVFSSTTIVSRVNFIGNGSAMLVGAYKDDAESKPTKTVVEDCFFAGNTIGGLGTVVVGNGTNHVFRNCVITENLGWACGGIGSLMGPGFTMIDMVITNNYAAGFDLGGGAFGFGGAALLSYHPMLGGKIVIKDNYFLTDGGAVLSNAGFIEGEMAPGVFLGSATLLDSFSADSEIGVTTANAVLGEIQPYPFILVLTNDTDFSSCFIADDVNSEISYNAKGQVQLVTYLAVVFDAAGGHFADDTTEKSVINAVSSTYIFPDEEPVRSGYEFLGWFDGVTRDAQQLDETNTVSVLKLFAQWNVVQDPEHPIVYEQSFDGGLTSDGYGATNVHPTAELAASGVTDVVMPDKINGVALLDIARYAYNENSYTGVVTSIKIGTFVTHIRPYAFRGTAVTNIEFAVPYDYLTGEKTTLYIQDRAFWETGVETLVFPAGGRYSFGQNAFSDNTEVQDVYFYGELDEDCWKLSPFRHIGEDRTAENAVRFHLNPSQAANPAFVKALTNGMDAACIVLAKEVLGNVKNGSFSVGADTLVLDFTINAASPWQTATIDTTYLLYSGDLTEVVVGKGNVLKPTSVEKQPNGSYKATFEKPETATGYFQVCVGD